MAEIVAVVERCLGVFLLKVVAGIAAVVGKLVV